VYHRVELADAGPALCVFDDTESALGAETLDQGAAIAAARHGHDGIATADELLDDVTSDKTGATRYEYSHFRYGI
jgi:hypothetical protein